MNPSLCPVCSGCGLVSAGFYDLQPVEAEEPRSREQCRACFGRGVIVEMGLPPWWREPLPIYWQIESAPCWQGPFGFAGSTIKVSTNDYGTVPEVNAAAGVPLSGVKSWGPGTL